MISIDKLNFLLIILSFVLACFLPFELFLFSYAFFGPLHYLTETNWIRDKKYFVDNTHWKYIVFISAIIYSLPYIFSLPFWSHLLDESTISFFTKNLVKYTNMLLLFVLVSAISSAFFKTYKAFIISFMFTLGFSFWLYTTDIYILILGLLLPTIIHVYVFTILFMIYGIRKEKNTFGIVNVALVLLLPISLFFIDLDFFSYRFSDIIKANYIDNNFHVLNANLANIFGVYEDLKFFFYEKIDLKIQIFIAFAYLYHYLNWFSKTTIIGWHKQLNRKKTIIIFSVWIVLLAAYYYDYRLGLILSIFFSISHVMFEFPLNIITIKQIFRLK
ncbi:hypothetical protein G5B37_01605 [Rasiella rasia]|uniref:Uncharacterized protein n=1 Tax=Rasiella rasia TaxID=2744027 RepID=A0A6G6GID3_9FLAO|nr:hypothetical protein [Rasiella rasia]QIE58308.1 hypothetical protein G5B37_01605 [Rasiella rasia]